MKKMRVWAVLGGFSLLVALALSALPHAHDAEPVFSAGSFLTIIKDPGGYFASRSVITLHADHTMLAVDSAEQGPAYFFSSQLGDWKPAGNHQISARLINFQYPLNPNGPGIARADYAINLSPNHRHLNGTITVTAFPLQEGNPFDGSGTPIGTFTFEGELIQP